MAVSDPAEIKDNPGKRYYVVDRGRVVTVCYSDSARQTPRYGVKKSTQVYLRVSGESPLVSSGPFYTTETEAAAHLQKLNQQREARESRKSSQTHPTLRVVELPDGNYDVVSGTKTYHVTGCCPENGNENVTAWSCNCLAGQHGRDCKHVQAVLDALN